MSSGQAAPQTPATAPSPLRSRHVRIDAALAAALFALLVAGVPGGGPIGVLRGPWWLAPAVGAVMLAPLVVRRRWPTGALPSVTAGAVAYQWVHPLNLVVPVAAIGMAMFTVALYAPRKSGPPVAAACASVFAILLVVMTQLVSAPMAVWPPRFALFAIVVGGAWIVGVNVRMSRQRSVELEAKTVELEHERRHSANQAATEERLRIARELHDVLGHHVSVMVMQAAGARRVLANDPGKAHDALLAIENSGRDAIAEMQRVLSVLRDPSTPGRPALDQLEDLVREVADAGVAVTVRRDEGLPALPPNVDLAVQRVIQESLTNTLRHAGPGSSVDIALRAQNGILLLEVVDDGARSAGRAGEAPAGAGRGLTGMRERIELLAGTFEAGPLPDGGFRVHATLPMSMEPGAP